MLLPLLLGKVRSDEAYYDFGSQYLKRACVIGGSHPKMVEDIAGNVETPVQLLIKFPIRLNNTVIDCVSSDCISEIRISVGEEADKLRMFDSQLFYGGFPAFFDLTEEASKEISAVLGLPQLSIQPLSLINMTSLFLALVSLNSTCDTADKNVFVIPGTWTIPQQQFLLRSALNAGLKNVEFLVDQDVVALQYANERSYLFKSTPKNVLFVDIGATSTKIYLHRFTQIKGEIKVEKISYETSPTEGGAFITAKLADYIASKTHRPNSLYEQRELFRVAEDTKCRLSLINEYKSKFDSDFSISIQLGELEQLMEENIHSITHLAKKVVGRNKVDTIEFLGGGSRFPSIKKALVKAFDLEKPGVTLHQTETLAKGGYLYSKNIAELHGLDFYNSFSIDSTVYTHRNFTTPVCIYKPPKRLNFKYHNPSPRLNTSEWSYQLSDVDEVCVIFQEPTNNIHHLELMHGNEERIQNVGMRSDSSIESFVKSVIEMRTNKELIELHYNNLESAYLLVTDNERIREDIEKQLDNSEIKVIRIALEEIGRALELCTLKIEGIELFDSLLKTIAPAVNAASNITNVKDKIAEGRAGVKEARDLMAAKNLTTHSKISPLIDRLEEATHDLQCKLEEGRVRKVTAVDVYAFEEIVGELNKKVHELRHEQPKRRSFVSLLFKFLSWFVGTKADDL